MFDFRKYGSVRVKKYKVVASMCKLVNSQQNEEWKFQQDNEKSTFEKYTKRSE